MARYFLSACPITLLHFPHSEHCAPPAYWHFHTNILNDKSFREAFIFLGCSHQKNKSGISLVQWWWDFGKSLIKQLSQQYTPNVTKYITRSFQDLEIEVVELHSQVVSAKDQGHIEAPESKKAALANLLGITAQEALVRSHFMNASHVDAPSQHFFGLERDAVAELCLRFSVSACV